VSFWVQYEELGMWGLWCAYFGADHPFSVVVSFEGARWSFSGATAPPAPAAQSKQKPAFSWVSESGLGLEVFSGLPIDPAVADCWTATLHYESRRLSGVHSFFPAYFPVSELGHSLNGLLLAPPQVLLLNGQPGTGKRTLLEFLGLLHAGRRLPAQNMVSLNLSAGARRAVVVPEVAMLEIEEQQALVKALRKGDSLWAATVYDLAMLKSRKILAPILVDMLDTAKVLLPAVARRETAELETLSAFWTALHGSQAGAAPANLSFLKQKAVGQTGLSVEAILEEGRGLRGVIAEFEKEAMIKAQARVGRSQHKIARLLKVSRGSLQHKLRKYQLESYASTDADTEEE